MTGLDTNVLVRYLAQDDARQSRAATQLIESLSAEAPGFVSVVALVELVWVLQSCYGSGKEEIANVIGQLLRAKELVVAQADVVLKALRLFANGKAGDLADCLISTLAAEAGCDSTVTFDRNAAKHCGMTLVG